MAIAKVVSVDAPTNRYPMNRFASWFGLTKLRNYEKKVLDAVHNALQDPIKGLFAAQLARVNKIQRLDHDREVDLYMIQNGRQYLPPEILFPFDREEFLMATVILSLSTDNNEVIVQVWEASSRLFALEFDRSPSFIQDVHVSSIHLAD